MRAAPPPGKGAQPCTAACACAGVPGPYRPLRRPRLSWGPGRAAHAPRAPRGRPGPARRESRLRGPAGGGLPNLPGGDCPALPQQPCPCPCPRGGFRRPPSPPVSRFTCSPAAGRAACSYHDCTGQGERAGPAPLYEAGGSPLACTGARGASLVGATLRPPGRPAQLLPWAKDVQFRCLGAAERRDYPNPIPSSCPC